MGFGQGVSGINAAAQNLDVIGNNISNSGTVGFKQSTATFADVYAGSRVGLGVRVNSVVQSFNQGNIEASGRALDVAITGGNGFFRLVDDAGQVYFSRNGQLKRLDDGRLVNASGLQVTGYPAGVQPGGGVQPQPLVIANTQMPPKATDSITAQFNLDSRVTAPTTPFATAAGDPPDSAMFNYSSTIEIFDSLGNPRQVTAYFRKMGPEHQDPLDPTTPVVGTNWNMYVTDENGGLLTTEAMRFDLNGNMVLPAAGATVGVPVAGANGAADMTVQMNLAGTTQFGSENDPKTLVQNGYASGALLGYTVQPDGSILGSFSNEQTMNLGQIVLATFGNVEGLQPEGDNVWTATGASGQPLLGAPGGSYGQLQSNAVEASNVDLSGQLVNLIIAQRTYQANAQTIQAQDQVLQTLVNI
ncbi:flagellar hook protein FlgE [Cupriavidus sp. AU9028]|uniref:flagellar hook protein FlgE n=1 Tax=Cupriavidus sp. AU9028 TaxID=2871157 RepID=UPI001C98E24A|nr:flagellar hook protein FlgE [Cupriavidus sp. AU9028]MBY4898454.1 flagellar hook protein FlgE [Cupriavidus sp. AU9028]